MDRLHKTVHTDEIIDLARKAGEAIMDVYTRDHMVELKDDQSPLTLADRWSHDIIVKGLRISTPDIPVVSEEGQGIDFDERKEWSDFWLVDPLDGTKEFIKRNGQFTVNIALISDKRPVFGLVYAPALAEMYYGWVDEGAKKQDENGECHDIKVNSSIDDGLKVVTSLSHRTEELEEYLQHLGPHEAVQMGSSLKFCVVAEGNAHLYPRIGPTMEWDTAAAHAVLEAAGGAVTDLNGYPLVYNKPRLVNPYFIATAIDL